MNNNYSNKKFLLIELVKADIKFRYNGSFLGFLWVFLRPFLTFLVIIFIFSFFFSNSDPHYRFNVLLGLIFFTYFSEGTARGLTALMDRSNLLLKTSFPRYLAIIATLLHSLVNFLIMLIASFTIWFLFRQEPISIFSAGNLLIFLSAIIITTALIAAFSFFTSVLFVKLRDLNSIWGVVLQLLMYFTPIIYPLNVLPIKLQIFFLLNPLTIIIDYTRASLLDIKSTVSVEYFLGIGILSLFFLFISYFYFKRNAHKVMELL